MFTLVAWAQEKWHTQSEAQWAPEGSRGSTGRGRFSKWRNLKKFSCCFCYFADVRYLFTHNLLITTAFISGTCECVNVHLPVVTQKAFLFVFSKSSEPGFLVEAGIIVANCLGKFLIDPRRKQYSQKPFWAVPAWIRSPSPAWISAGIKHSCFLGIILMLMLHPVYTLILAT